MNLSWWKNQNWDLTKGENGNLFLLISVQISVRCPWNITEGIYRVLALSSWFFLSVFIWKMKVKREYQVLGGIFNESMMMRFQHKHLGEIVDMSDIRAAKIISAPRVTGFPYQKWNRDFYTVFKGTENFNCNLVLLDLKILVETQESIDERSLKGEYGRLDLFWLEFLSHI